MNDNPFTTIADEKNNSSHCSSTLALMTQTDASDVIGYSKTPSPPPPYDVTHQNQPLIAQMLSNAPMNQVVQYNINIGSWAIGNGHPGVKPNPTSANSQSADVDASRGNGNYASGQRLQLVGEDGGVSVHPGADMNAGARTNGGCGVPNIPSISSAFRMTEHGGTAVPSASQGAREWVALPLPQRSLPPLSQVVRGSLGRGYSRSNATKRGKHLVLSKSGKTPTKTSAANSQCPNSQLEFQPLHRELFYEGPTTHSTHQTQRRSLKRRQAHSAPRQHLPATTHVALMRVPLHHRPVMHVFPRQTIIVRKPHPNQVLPQTAVVTQPDGEEVSHSTNQQQLVLHTKQQAVSSNQQPSSTYQQPSSSYQQPSSRYQQPSSSYQQAPSSYQQPLSSYQQPSFSYQQLPSSYQHPSSNLQQSSSSYQQPPSSYQQPPSSYQQPPSSYQQSPSSCQQPSTNYQQPSTNYHQPTSSYQQVMPQQPVAVNNMLPASPKPPELLAQPLLARKSIADRLTTTGGEQPSIAASKPPIIAEKPFVEPTVANQPSSAPQCSSFTPSPPNSSNSSPASSFTDEVLLSARRGRRGKLPIVKFLSPDEKASQVSSPSPALTECESVGKESDDDLKVVGVFSLQRSKDCKEMKEEAPSDDADHASLKSMMDNFVRSLPKNLNAKQVGGIVEQLRRSKYSRLTVERIVNILRRQYACKDDGKSREKGVVEAQTQTPSAGKHISRHKCNAALSRKVSGGADQKRKVEDDALDLLNMGLPEHNGCKRAPGKRKRTHGFSGVKFVKEEPEATSFPEKSDTFPTRKRARMSVGGSSKAARMDLVYERLLHRLRDEQTLTLDPMVQLRDPGGFQVKLEKMSAVQCRKWMRRK